MGDGRDGFDECTAAVPASAAAVPAVSAAVPAAATVPAAEAAVPTVSATATVPAVAAVSAAAATAGRFGILVGSEGCKYRKKMGAYCGRGPGKGSTTAAAGSAAGGTR